LHWPESASGKLKGRAATDNEEDDADEEEKGAVGKEEDNEGEGEAEEEDGGGGGEGSDARSWLPCSATALGKFSGRPSGAACKS
jgi:hypothetical protein